MQSDRPDWPLHPAVVLSVSPTGLSVARSLAPRGVEVYGIDQDRREIGHYSRLFKRDPKMCYLPPGPELLDALMEFGAAQSLPPVLFLAGDPYIDFVGDNHEDLRKHFVLTESMRPESNSLILNKRPFYERCEELGIAMPRTFFPTSEEEAIAASEQLRYPSIVKPSMGHLFRARLKGDKLVEVESAEDLVRWWRQFRDWGGDTVLQEVIEGPEANIFVGGMYTDASGVCRSLFTACKTRQFPPMYGSGSYMEACWNQEIADLSIDLIDKLGYKGICGTEFKWDARDQKWKLIEVNPRPTLWYSLTRAAGVDVIWDNYCDVLGHPNPIHINCQDDRIRWQLLVRDIVSGIHFLRSGDLSFGEFVRTVVNPLSKDYAVLSSKDLGTTFGYPMNTFSKYTEKILGRGSSG